MTALPVLAFAALLAVAASPANAEPAKPHALPPAFHAGPVIPAFGKVASVESDMALPADAVWKHSFDIVESEKGKLGRSLESAARFVNMMAEAGIAGDRLKVALVVHGPAVFDVSVPATYSKKYKGSENPNAALVAALVAAGVDIWVCGQSAAALGVEKSDLLPGVKMALSAMTAHADLQRQGYSVNPF